jgi:glyoxylase-like metal-dependent hydrolase (beta-lactamase superfamily II)
MLRSLADKVLPLADDTVVLPGHGPSTTIGRERRSNPFLQGVAGSADHERIAPRSSG